MTRKKFKIFIAIIISSMLNGCAGNNKFASDTEFSKLEDEQLLTYEIMEDKGYITKTKSPNLALGLSFLPAVGSIYSGNYKSSFLDILFYPYTLLFMPYLNYNHTQYEAYYRSKQDLRAKALRSYKKLDYLFEKKIITEEQYKLYKSNIIGKYTIE